MKSATTFLCDRGPRLRTDLQALELLEAAHQKRELRLERRTPLALVKRAEKRILLRLHDPLRVESLRQDSGQRALADSDGALNCDVAGKFKKIGHELVRSRKTQDSSDADA